MHKFFDEINELVDVPKRDANYVRGMVNFALTYPKREKEFIEETKMLFPSKSKISSKDVIDKVKSDPNVTENQLPTSQQKLSLTFSMNYTQAD